MYARRIVQEFGADTLNVIEDNPDELIRVPGIGKVRVEKIKKSWAEQKEIKNIMLFLQGHDVSTAHATKIFKQYGADSVDVVRENPYRLADDIWGIGFKTADTIAAKLGFEKEKTVRLRSGLMYTLNKLAEDGHCYAESDQLIEAGVTLLDVRAELLTDTLNEMIQAEDVILVRIPDTEDYAIYLPPFFRSETGIHNRLRKIAETAPVRPVREPEGSGDGVEYDEAQLKAIRTARERELCRRFDLDFIASGGVSSLADVRALRDAGLSGAIIGKAYYIGAIDLKEAIREAT